MSTIDIRKIRTESGLSQKDFAKKIGVHWRTIQNWEKNGGIPESEYTKACALLEHKSTQNKAQALWRRILRATGICDHRSVDSNISARRVVERLHRIGDGI